MVVYGLTGGVGMGKSTAGEICSRLGVPVVDTDIIAREVVQPGTEGLEQVVAAFGSDYLLPDGALDRRKLADSVFTDEAKLKALEAIVHPLIRARWMRQIEAWETEGQPKGVVIIPLLFETGAQSSLAKVICIACSEITQRQRLRQRGWNDFEIERRLKNQWPIGRKMDSADYVVWNESTFEICEKQVARIL